MKKYFVFAFAIALFLAATAKSGKVAFGQDRPVVEVGMVMYDYSATVDPRQDDADTEIMSVATWLGLSFPMNLAGGRTRLNHSFTYIHLDKDFRNWRYAENSDEFVVHSGSYIYRLDAAHRVSENWQLIGSIAPEVKSNLEYSMSGSHYFVSGSGRVMHTIDQRVTIGVGAAYSKRFGRLLPYPLIAMEWTGPSDVTASVLLPENVEIRWRPLDFLSLGAHARVDGDLFRGGTVGTYGIDDARVRFTNAVIGQSFEARLADWFSLTGEGGYSIYRQFRADNTAGEKVNFDTGQAAYVRIGMRIGVN